MNRPNETLEFSGQLNTSITGGDQCHEFYQLLLNNKTENLKEDLCVETLKSFAKKGVVQAAYVNQGLNLFDKKSQRHRQQKGYAIYFSQRFTAAIDEGVEHFPSLKDDREFMLVQSTRLSPFG